MFGPDARLAINREPAPLPNEQSLVAELRAKLGPGPDQDKVLFSIRSARGKTHWAVNSYLRDIMSAGCVPGEEDFHPGRARVQTSGAAGPTAVASTAEGQAADDPMPQSPDLTDESAAQFAERSGLDALPSSVLELVLKHLDYISLCAAALTCKALAAVAASDALWSSLFAARWGAVVFPTEAYLAMGAAGGGVGAGAGGWPGAGAGAWPGAGVGQVAAGSAAAMAATGGTGPGIALAGLALCEPDSLPHATVDGAKAAGEPGPGSRPGDGLRQSALFRLGSGLAPVREDSTPPPAQRQQTPLSAACTPRSVAGAFSRVDTLQKASTEACPIASNSAQVSDAGVTSSKPHQAATGVASMGSTVPAATGVSGMGSTGSRSSSPDGDSSARRRYRDQVAFLKSLRCPRCGGAALLPILYGFPSAKLLEGMRSKRLILGGDHLIESCHVWGCPNDRCGASYRFFPYDRVDEWMTDLAKPQPAGPHYTYEL